MRRTRLLTVAAAVSLIAAAAAPAALHAQAAAPAPADTQVKKKPVKGRGNLITEEEIASNGSFTNALEIVQRLRPSMLRVRGGAGGAQASEASSSGGGGMDAGSAEIKVYVDNQPMGGVDALRQIVPAQLKEIKYLSPSDATTLFGTGNSAGAIQVISKR